MEEFKQKAKQCATDALHLFDSEVKQDSSSGTCIKKAILLVFPCIDWS